MIHMKELNGIPLTYDANTTTIMPKGTGIVLPSIFENEEIYSALAGVHKRTGTQDLGYAFAKLLLEHWKETINTSGEDLEDIVLSVVNSDIPSAIKDRVHVADHKTSGNKVYSNIKFQLYFYSEKLKADTSITTEYYVEHSPNGRAIKLLTDARDRSIASKAVNESHFVSFTEEDILKNLEFTTWGRSLGIYSIKTQERDVKVTLASVLPHRAKYPVNIETDTIFIDHIDFCIPKIKVEGKKLSFGMYAVGRYSPNGYTAKSIGIDLSQKSFKLNGAQYAKGTWKASASKTLSLSYPEQEAINDFKDLVNGNTHNKLLAHMYKVIQVNDDLVSLEDIEKNLYIVRLSEEKIEVLYCTSSSTNLELRDRSPGAIQMKEHLRLYKKLST